MRSPNYLLAGLRPTILSVLAALTLLSAPQAAHALNCSASYQLNETFSNGATWEMCWENRTREGIVYSDIHFTNAEGDRRKIFHQANVAQIHVPYDDDGARFHDVSDFGLGTAIALADLKTIDCPNGTRVSDGGKRVLCKTSMTGVDIAATGGGVDRGDAFSVFSVSAIGAYNYIPEWVFFDDGTIEVSMGATGELQRYGSDHDHGWPVNSSANPVGISHLHNYFWRFDFDIGDDAANDVVEEIEFIAEDGSNRKRSKAVTTFTTEAARSVSQETMRFWRVQDTGITNTEGAPVSYDILPLETGHRDTGPSFEPFTFYDLYITRYRSCEMFASHNPSDGPGGCSANEDVSDFVDGESINGDPVVWVGLTFHHIPRDEEEPRMAAHWNRFRLVPRDWTAGVSPDPNTAPVLTDPGSQSDNVGDAVALQLVATDDDGDTLTYSASGLPGGLSINASTGLVSGSPITVGSFVVDLAVTDAPGASDTVLMNWDIDPRPNTAPNVENPGTQDDDAGDFVNLQIVADDDDGDTLTYSAGNLPPGVSIDAATGLIAGQLTSVGVFTVDISVSDGFSGVGNVQFTWNVSAPTSNVAPIVTNPGDQESSVDDNVVLNIAAIDVNGDALDYSATGLPDGLTINQVTGEISGVATAGGTFNVVVTVDDNNGGATPVAFNWVVSEGFVIDVGPLGRGLTGLDSATGSGYAMYTSERIQTRFISPPIDPNSADHIVIVRFSGGNWQYVTDNTYVNFAARADDLLIAEVDFSADTVTPMAGSNVNINGISAGYIDSDVIITPNFWNGSPNAGEFGITGTYILASGSPPPEPNFAPILAPVGNQFGVIGDNVTLNLQATDANNDPLTFSAPGLPGGLSINPSSGLISGQLNSLGTFNPTIQVSDGNGGVDDEQITWAVTDGSGATINIGPVGRGITGRDNASGIGYAMYTEERIQTRFVSPPIDPNSADHILAVRYSNSNASWQYITDNEFVNFTPRTTDLIVAELDFSADTVNMLLGTNTVNNGIQSGYASGDINITPNQWNGNFNAGEFGLSGTQIVTN